MNKKDNIKNMEGADSIAKKASQENVQEWYEKWRIESQKNPLRLEVQIVELKSNQKQPLVKVFVFAKRAAGTSKLSRILLLDEVLLSETSDHLEIALQDIVRQKCFSKEEEALAFLISKAVILLELAKHLGDQPSALIEKRHQLEYDNVHAVRENKWSQFITTVKPVFPLKPLLDFWNEFEHILIQWPEGSKKHSYTQIPPTPKSNLGDKVENPAEIDQATLRHILEALELLQNQIAPDWAETLIDNKSKTKKTKIKKEFPQLDGLGWKEVTMIFIKRDEIKIEARDRQEIFRYSQIGFVDGRKRVPCPDSRWEVLRNDFAMNDGFVTGAIRKTDFNLKAAVKDINNILKQVMHIEESPIFYDRGKAAYRTKLKRIDYRERSR